VHRECPISDCIQSGEAIVQDIDRILEIATQMKENRALLMFDAVD
jgi:hypothetical protein